MKGVDGVLCGLAQAGEWNWRVLMRFYREVLYHNLLRLLLLSILFNKPMKVSI